jgi:hypothetical protein
MIFNLSNRVRRAVPVGAMAAALLAGGACTVQDSLLEQQQPQIIRPEDVTSATGALSLYNGALSRFRTALNGGNNNQETIWNFEGLMTDEVQSADSFLERNNADQRVTQTNDAVMQATYDRAQQSRGYARDAINALRKYAPTETTKIAEMYMEIGFMELTLGQAFCNGIPLGETIDGVPQYTKPLTNTEVFQAAIAREDSALTLLTGNDALSVAVRNAALVTKARAMVNLGQHAQAATVVAPVPTAFAYLITYSITSSLSNEWWQMFASSKRFSVGDSVDPTNKQRIMNAIPFYSAGDPRVKVGPRTTTVGLDTKTPFTDMQNWGREDPISLVNGLDARLIEAEASLQAGNYAAMMTTLNALRAAPPKNGNLTIAAMPALANGTPTTKDAAADIYFREKAFWQYGRGERFSDLRRLTRQYGRGAETVWPTGAYQPLKGGSFGTNTQFPVPDSERANPNFAGCIDRNP